MTEKNTELKSDILIGKNEDFSIDTMKINDYLLTFEDADSFEQIDIYGDLDYRNKLTDTVNRNWGERARKIQTYLTDQFGDYFYATDTMLVLKLANNDTLSFVTEGENTDGHTSYIFEHYFDQIDYFLLQVLYWEGNSWLLVNRKNGFKKEITGLPYISEDNTKIITVNSDLDAGYTFNGIELYTILADSLQTEFRKETEWGPLDVKWINENEFLLKREYYHNNGNNVDYTRVKIEKMNHPPRKQQ
ncbi:MAG: hypothetical protein LBR55_01210 [Bacteroidales bacterium]|nr:hypothetical protein [Bacteroidales bacterium]